MKEWRNDLKSLYRQETKCRVLRILATRDTVCVPPGAETQVSDALLLSREISLPAVKGELASS